MSGKLIQIVGIAATFVGFIAELASGWANEKKMNETIKEEVNKAFDEREKGSEI